MMGLSGSDSDSDQEELNGKTKIRPKKSRNSHNPTSIRPMLKLCSFEDDLCSRFKPSVPNLNDVVLVQMPALPKKPKQEPDEATILKRILKEINELDLLRQKQQQEAKNDERTFYGADGAHSPTATSQGIDVEDNSLADLINFRSPVYSDRERKAVTLQTQLESILNPIDGITLCGNEAVIFRRSALSPRSQSVHLIGRPQSAKGPTPKSVKPAARPQSAKASLPGESCKNSTGYNVNETEFPKVDHDCLANPRALTGRRWRNKSCANHCDAEDEDPLEEETLAQNGRSFGFNMRAETLLQNGENLQVNASYFREKDLFQKLLQQRRQQNYPTLNKLLSETKQNAAAKPIESGKKLKEPFIPWPTQSGTRKDDLWNHVQNQREAQS